MGIWCREKCWTTFGIMDDFVEIYQNWRLMRFRLKSSRTEGSARRAGSFHIHSARNVERGFIFPQRGEGSEDQKLCFLQAHSDTCLGLMRSDAELFIGHNKKKWKRLTAADIERTKRHIKALDLAF